jgi:mannose-6-phosphate isomerase class I
VVELRSDDLARSRELAKDMAHFAEEERGDCDEAACIALLAAAYPEDRCLIAPLLLNHVVLERWQTMQVRPNTVHCYIPARRSR